MSNENADVKRCLTCGEKAASRGLCRACYTIARLRVNSNVTTWKWLEEHNLALPSTKQDRKSKFSEAFEAAQTQEADSQPNPPASQPAPPAYVNRPIVNQGQPVRYVDPAGPPARYVDPAPTAVVEDVSESAVWEAPVADYTPPPTGAEVPGRSQLVPVNVPQYAHDTSAGRVIQPDVPVQGAPVQI